MKGRLRAWARRTMKNEMGLWIIGCLLLAGVGLLVMALA